MEKKIAAKMLLTSVEIGFKTLPALAGSEVAFGRKAKNRRFYWSSRGPSGGPWATPGGLLGRPGCSSVALGWLSLVMSYEAATELSGTQWNSAQTNRNATPVTAQKLSSVISILVDLLIT